VITTLSAPVETQFALPWGLLLGTAWLVGAVLFLVARVLEYRAMRRRLLAGAIEVDRRDAVRLVETPAVDAPVAFGVRDKVIALPPRFLITGSISERALAVDHELAHHRGRDLLANWLAQPILAQHWFNPLAWAAWNAMRRDQEAACDARALAGRDLATRAAYARVIASFAAGERMVHRAALAAPMACPVLGDKSIVHRLRSLTMTDISPRRVRTGRWALAAGAVLTLPTATVVYAGQEAPEPDTVAVDEAAPEAPPAPGTRQVERRVIVMEHRDHDDGKHHQEAKYERKIEKDGKTVVIRSDEPIDEGDVEVRLKKLDKLDKLPLRLGDRVEVVDKEGKPAKAMRRFVIADMDGKRLREGQRVAVAVSRCADGPTIADADASHESGDAKSRRVERSHVLICGDPGKGAAEALAKVRGARDRIAASGEMSAEVRDDILKQLDETIARLERDSH
jgi:hypothetical protein